MGWSLFFNAKKNPSPKLQRRWVFSKNLTKRQPSPTPCANAMTNSKYFYYLISLSSKYLLLVQKGQVHNPYIVGNTNEKPTHIIKINGIPIFKKSENL